MGLTTRPLFTGLGVALLILSAGCAGGPGKKATVTGKVSYKGTPLTAGTLEFHGANNKISGASINPDGTYIMNDPPAGEVTVTVRVPTPSKAPPGVNMPEPNAKPVSIPAKYSDPSKSGIKKNIPADDSQVDIDLT